MNSKNQFGYNIAPDRDTDQDMENYCAVSYRLSSEYHNGTYEPSPSPSTIPSMMTPIPSVIKSQTP